MVAKLFFSYYDKYTFNRLLREVHAERMLIMTYEEAVSYLNETKKYGMVLGLDTMKLLLEKLEHPEKNVSIIHVAGTNGKGSVCAMLNQILLQSDYTVGLYTSPYIVRFNDCISLNNTPIPEQDFAYYVMKIADACRLMVHDGKQHPTLYECLTALAFLYFSESEVDYAIIEVCLGGRLDATNAIDKVLLSIITSISLDHTAQLGHTVEAIATEKSGIIKTHTPVVLAPNPSNIYKVIQDKCYFSQSKLYYHSQETIHIELLEETLSHITFNITGKTFSYPNLKLSLLGQHQLSNAYTALLAVEALRDIGVILEDSIIYNSLSNVHWSCRMEYLLLNQLVLLDGAHNIDSIKALAKYLKRHYPAEKITLVLGLLEDKPAKAILETLIPRVNQIIMTLPLNKRRLPFSEMKKALPPNDKKILWIEHYSEAFQTAQSITEEDGLICCTGSLYLVEHIRSAITQD